MGNENKVIRRFFRREADELTVHDRAFSPHLRVVAYHIFASMLEHYDIGVVEVANFDDYSQDYISVQWSACAVGFEENRQYITTGYAMVEHRAFDNLRFVAAVITEDGAAVLRLIFRSEDIEYLEPLLEWLEELEKKNHPLQGKLFSLTKSRLDFLPDQKIDRDDVIMSAEILDEVERNFAFLDNPQGYPAPLRHRAILLAGQPGVGKTMIAKWLSGRYSCTGLWVTPGALWEIGPSAVFDLARSLKPSLLILEDLDVAAGDRKGNQPLGDLLGQMDGFIDLEDVAIIATTNCPEVIDEALDPKKRPGRFHRMFKVEPPNASERRRMLRLVLSDSKVILEMPPESLEQLVGGTEKQTGAQLTELVRNIEIRLLWGRLKDKEVDVATVVDELVLDQAKAQGGFGFAACGAAS